MRFLPVVIILFFVSCGPEPLKPTVPFDGGGSTGNGNGTGNNNGNGNGTGNNGNGEEPGPGNEEPPPPSRVLYVNSAVAEGGDGTSAAPFKSLQAAINFAPEDAEVRVAAGEYNEPIVISKGLTLIGGFSRSDFELQSEQPTVLRDMRSVGGESLVDPIAALWIKSENAPVFLKNMEIIGANVDQDTTSSAQYDEISIALAIKDSKNVTIENVKISGGKSGLYTVGLSANQSLLNLFKSTVDGGGGHNTYGVYFTGDSSVKVTDNRISAGAGAASSSAVVGYEYGSALYARNRIFAGSGLQNCFGFRVATPTTGLKSFYNNVVDRSECTGSLVGVEIWGNSLRSGTVAIRNNTISANDNLSSNQNVVLKLTSLYSAHVEITNNILEGDRRTTQSTCIVESDINSHPSLMRYNNFTNCNFLYYRFNSSGGRNLNTVSEMESVPEANIFGNAQVAVTFIDDMKPAGGTDLKVLQGGINGATEEWPDVADFLGKARTGKPDGLGWSMGAYEFESF